MRAPATRGWAGSSRARADRRPGRRRAYRRRRSRWSRPPRWPPGARGPPAAGAVEDGHAHAPSSTSRTSSCTTASAAALPKKIAAGSRPDRRRASRLPSADSTPNDPLDGQHRREEHRGPVEAAGEAPQRLGVGVEREPEQHEHQDRERGDLADRHPRAPLDPQVLAAISRASRNIGASAAGSGPAGRTGAPAVVDHHAAIGAPAMVTTRGRPCRVRSSSCEATPARWRRRPPRRARACRRCRDRPGRARRGARRAATAGAGGPRAPRATCAGAAPPRAAPRARRAGARRSRGGRSPRRPRPRSPRPPRRPEPHVLGDAQVVVEERGVRQHAHLAAHTTPVAREIVVEHEGHARFHRQQPAHSRSRLVLPAPLGPCSSTASPAATSRSTPASAGNRPSSATTARRNGDDGAMAEPYRPRAARRRGPGRTRPPAVPGAPCALQFRRPPPADGPPW